MVEENLKKEEDHGKVLMEWVFPEHEKKERGPLWYLIGITVLAVTVVISFVSGNFLFAVFLILFALIIFLDIKRPTLEVDFKICEEGIVLGSRFYEWSEINNFSLVYRPPEVKNLYLELDKKLSPEISISLEEQDPVKVREILNDYLEEDLERKDESFFDRLSRWLKI